MFAKKGMNRKSLQIQRLTFGSLFKVHLLTGLGLCVPFFLLGLFFALFAPGSIRLEEGATMGSFYGTLFSLPLIWPPLFALLLVCPGWVAFAVKGAFSRTTLEVIESGAPPLRGDDPGSLTPSELAGAPAHRPEVRARARQKTILLVVGAVAVTAAVCFYITRPTYHLPKARLMVDSPDRAFTAVVVEFDEPWRVPPEMRTQVIHLVGKAEVEQSPTLAPGVELGARGRYVASIDSCADGDIDVLWTSPRTLVIRYTQAKPDMVSWLKTFEGVSILLEERPGP